MAKTLKQAEVKTTGPARRTTPRLPHERDESDDSQATAPRKNMQQAHDDLEEGQVDTDLRGTRGVDQVGETPNKLPGKTRTPADSAVNNPADATKTKSR